MKKLLVILLLLPGSMFAQKRYDVVIDEIMCDPSPVVGLPNNEWIELKNTSSAAVDLADWRIGDTNGASGPMSSFVLQPDSLLIICSATALPAMINLGSAISVTSFPSLDNEGEMIYLQDRNGNIIHAVSYSSEWFENEIKSQGGWTLEMIDTKLPCLEKTNWKSSVALAGGTPGKKNSIDDINMDRAGPQLKNAYLTDSETIILVFDKAIDSLAAANTSNFYIDQGLVINQANALPPLFNRVALKVDAGMRLNMIYHLQADHLSDCRGNAMDDVDSIKIGLPTVPASGDIILNEILFNPRPNAYDYLEIYNRSTKIVDVSQLYVANRNAGGVISNAIIMSSAPYYIFPGDYVVVTEDIASLQLNYLVKYPDNVRAVHSLPYMPDDAGDILLLNSQGLTIDEVNYNKAWHFKLLANDDGVSLERVDPNASSQNANNWHSAATTAGYGTPGYANSQYKQLQVIDAAINITPKIFSPDNDGNDDIASIQYKVMEVGFIANITIFDSRGIPVRVLVNNETMALSGYWNWDGLDDKSMKLPIGTYIVSTEIFNLEGKKRHFKNVIILAKKLN